jgi:hypothetical protein
MRQNSPSWARDWYAIKPDENVALLFMIKSQVNLAVHFPGVLSAGFFVDEIRQKLDEQIRHAAHARLSPAIHRRCWGHRASLSSFDRAPGCDVPNEDPHEKD